MCPLKVFGNCSLQCPNGKQFCTIIMQHHTGHFLQVSEVELIGHQPYNAYLSPSSISFLFVPEFFKVSEVTERELNFYFDK
jgi:hypothetical protein